MPTGISETTTSPYETLKTFWCGTVGANGQPLPGCGSSGLLLTDTQIAFDPFNQRWVATTLSVNGGTFTLYFAYTTTATVQDTGGNWKRWSQPVVCSSGSTGDQPILGYDTDWIAIDTLCVSTTNPGQFTADSFIVIPQSDVTNETFNPVTKTLPATIMRPSRDISASGYPYLMLVSSVVPAPPALPHIDIANINSSGAVSALSASPTIGFAGCYQLPTAQQPGCTTTGSGCEIDPGDARITSAIIQKGAADGNHYLLAAFPAGLTNSSNNCSPPDSNSQLSTFVEQIETGAWNGTLSVNYGAVAYPNLVADPDLDIYETYAQFDPTQYPFSSYWLYHNFGTGPYSSAGLVGVGNLTTGSVAYTGELSCNPTLPFQRWGDFMTTVYDPSVTSASGEQGAFWTVQEFSTGGTNESTEWFELNDPFPFFVASVTGESECANGPGSPCSVTIAAPSNASYGDMFVMSLETAGNVTKLPKTPSGWTYMPVSNLGGNRMFVTDPCPGNPSKNRYPLTTWLLIHEYGSSNDNSDFNGKYTFTYTPQTFYNCSGQGYYGELIAFLTAYRGTGLNTADYLINGFPSSTDTNTITIGQLLSPLEGSTILDIFAPAFAEVEGSENANVTAPSGSPAITPETPLSKIKFLAADVPVPGSGAAFGPYSTTYSNSAGFIGPTFGWEVVIPEQ